MVEERRLAAILAADVVGYSRLMEQDEAATLAALKQRRKGILAPLVSEHHGRIVKVMGDGVLVEFASAVNAVACAVELQKRMAAANDAAAEDRRILLRVGINLGDVVVEGGDLYGEGVIIAVRLQSLAEVGGILVSHTVHDQVARKLPVNFQDQGERALKNIVRPIRTYRADWSDAAAARTLQTAQSQLGLPDKASIAVLPFVNMGTGAEQDAFADGLAEDLITDLSKIPGLLVIARNSSFSYKGRSIDIRAIAKDLGVRYVIEGSVRRAETRVRINAQLIDAVSGSHLWAERYDRVLTDIFVVQDEVVGEIVRALAGTLPSARLSSKRRATNLEAYELFIRGRPLVSLSLGDTRAARLLLDKAIELDSGFAEAHAWLAMSHIIGWMYCNEGDEHRALARSAAERSLALEPENADAHIILGWLRAYDGELSEGVAEFEHGLRINPNHADGWAILGDLRVLEGRAAEGIDCTRYGFRLNPHPSGNYFWALGWAQYGASLYQDAVDTLRHKGAGGPGRQRILAAALAQLGRLTEAREEAQKFLVEYPHFSSRRWGETQPFRYEKDRQHFIEGYLKAGLPA